MDNSVINIARDFSRAPGGRFISDGPNSGERFRKEFLVPAVQKGAFQVVLDGTRGLGSSFLEEAFGGLVRLGFAPDLLRDRVVLISNDPSLVAEIKSYWH